MALSTESSSCLKSTSSWRSQVSSRCRVHSAVAMARSSRVATGSPASSRASNAGPPSLASKTGVSAVAFASLFEGGTKFKDLVDALGGGAAAKASAEEKLVPVVIAAADGGEEEDGGIALVGPNTSLEDVRTQLYRRRTSNPGHRSSSERPA